jgi:hypothetical protein
VPRPTCGCRACTSPHTARSWSLLHSATCKPRPLVVYCRVCSPCAVYTFQHVCLLLCSFAGTASALTSQRLPSQHSVWPLQHSVWPHSTASGPYSTASGPYSTASALTAQRLASQHSVWPHSTASALTAQRLASQHRVCPHSTASGPFCRSRSSCSYTEQKHFTETLCTTV